MTFCLATALDQSHRVCPIRLLCLGCVPLPVTVGVAKGYGMCMFPVDESPQEYAV